MERKSLSKTQNSQIQQLFGRSSPLRFLLAALLLSLTSLLAGDKVYIVQKNDTLSHIAARHKTTVPLLVEYNHLQQPDKIFVGQRLAIPGQGYELPPDVQERLDAVPVSKTRWRYIVIHHSATASGTAAGMDRYHRVERRMENGLAYHFVIGNGQGMRDGEIAVGNRWIKQQDGGHLSSLALNRKAIGICLVGHFDEEDPTPKQLESLHALIDYLIPKGAISTVNIRTHQQINTIHTRCPGRRFPIKAFFKDLKERHD